LRQEYSFDKLSEARNVANLQFRQLRAEYFCIVSLTKTKRKMRKVISWVEIPATNMERAINFYNALLGLDLKLLDFGEEKMACFPNDEGAISQAPGFNPSKDGILLSLNTGDGLDEAIATLQKNGGHLVKPKTKIEAEGRGYFAIFIDSEGNKVGLYGDA